jgi:hypothetical protein
VVTTRGPGKLSLLTYLSDNGGANVNGSLSTNNVGVTRFLISFSHNYRRFPFIWEGSGEAVYSIGTGLERKPVGKNWSQASVVVWTTNTVTTADVNSFLAQTVDGTNMTTLFIIPDLT